MNNTKGGVNPAGYAGSGYGYAQNRQEINLPFMPASNPTQYEPPANVSVKDQAPGTQVATGGPAPVTFPGGVEASTPPPIGPGGSTGYRSPPWWQRLGHPIWHGQAPVPIGVLDIGLHPMTGRIYG
jgi:hypothetical protein